MGCAAGLIKFLVFIANLIFALAGLALMIIGILIKFNVSDVARILPSDFGLAPILSIIIGAVVFVTAFLGCCGAVKESTCMLTTYAIILLTIFILQVAIGVYAFLQIKDVQQFRRVVRENVQRTFDNRYSSQEANETMQITQRFLHCCGVDGPDDYGSFILQGSYPPSCCTNSQASVCSGLNNDLYRDGCYQKLYEKLTSSSQVIGGVAIGIAAVEIVGAIFGLCLASSIRNSYRRHIYA